MDKVIIANITTNLPGLTEQTAEQESIDKEAKEAATEAAKKLPQARIAQLVDLGDVVPDVVATDPITGEGNPALWIDVPRTGTATPGAPQ